MSEPPTKGQLERQFRAWGFLDAAGTVLAATTLAGFLGTAWWCFELTSHFRIQYAAGLALLALLSAIRRRRAPAVCFGVLTMVNAAVVLPLLLPDRTPRVKPAITLRVAVLNVETANEHYQLVRDFLSGANADVILVLEVNERWAKELAGLAPHVVAEPREDNFGIALFSRWPIEDARTVELGEAGVPSVLATISIGAAKVRVLGTHPLPPGSAEYSRLRNQQFSALAEQVRRESLPVILVGDLNATPWSPWFKRLLQDSRLKNSSQGRGIFASWPAQFLPLRIPLDHCLISPDIWVAGKKLGPGVGSDHLPVILDLAVPAVYEASLKP